MYKGSLENLKEKCRNDNHKMFYEGELDLFELVHEGNIDNWFKEIIKDSKELLKGQKLRKA